jgi:carboxymethylenebutenolidase
VIWDLRLVPRLLGSRHFCYSFGLRGEQTSRIIHHMKLRNFCLLLLVLALSPVSAKSQAESKPSTIVISSGSLKLHARLWRPAGSGPFPAVLYSSGSGQPPSHNLGSVFAKHGYIFLELYRRGQGLSANAGDEAGSLMRRERDTKGDEAANRLQMQLLEGIELQQQRDALAALRSLRGVDPRRVAVVGFSFGGSLSMLHAEADPTIRAVINFGGGAGSWNRLPQLRERLISAARKITVPVFFVYAANDYTTLPAEVLSAELARAQPANAKVHRLKIYPPLGETVQEGHHLIYISIPTWERDVIDFLNIHTTPRN